MIYRLKELRIGSVVIKVHETVSMPPDVLVFRDEHGREVGRITDFNIANSSSLPAGDQK